MRGGKALDFLIQKLRAFLRYLRGTPLFSWLERRVFHSFDLSILEQRFFERLLWVFILYIVYAIMVFWFWKREEEAEWRDRLRLARVRLWERYRRYKKLFLSRLLEDHYVVCLLLLFLFLGVFVGLVGLFEFIVHLWRG